MRDIDRYIRTSLEQPHLGDAKVFAQAHDIQNYFDANVFESVEEASSAAITSCNTLDRVASEQGVMGMPVEISAPWFWSSVTGRNLETGLMETKPYKVERGKDDLEDPTAVGLFVGFTEMVHATDTPGGVVAGAHATLCYQVEGLQRLVLPNLLGNLCLASPVRGARLEFHKDRRITDTLTALHSIAESPSRHTQALARYILDATPKLVTGHESASKIGRVVRKTLNAHGEHVPDQDRQDLLDLIAARINVYRRWPLYMDADAALVKQEDGTGGKIAHFFLPTTFPQGLTFAESFTLRGAQGPTEQMPHSPAVTHVETLAFDGEKVIVQVPIERIRQLLPAINEPE